MRLASPSSTHPHPMQSAFMSTPNIPACLTTKGPRKGDPSESADYMAGWGLYANWPQLTDVLIRTIVLPYQEFLIRRSSIMRDGRAHVWHRDLIEGISATASGLRIQSSILNEPLSLLQAARHNSMFLATITMKKLIVRPQLDLSHVELLDELAWQILLRATNPVTGSPKEAAVFAAIIYAGFQEKEEKTGKPADCLFRHQLQINVMTTFAALFYHRSESSIQAAAMGHTRFRLEDAVSSLGYLAQFVGALYNVRLLDPECVLACLELLLADMHRIEHVLAAGAILGWCERDPWTSRSPGANMKLNLGQSYEGKVWPQGADEYLKAFKREVAVLKAKAGMAKDKRLFMLPQAQFPQELLEAQQRVSAHVSRLQFKMPPQEDYDCSTPTTATVPITPASRSPDPA